MAAPAAGPAAPAPDLAALAAALTLGDHAALRQASTPEVLLAIIAAYGGAGSPPLLAALAAGGHAALRAACARNDWPSEVEEYDDACSASDAQAANRLEMVRLLFEAYGGEGSDALSDALAAVCTGCLLSASRLADGPVLEMLINAYGGAGSDALIAALCAGGGRHARHAALLSMGAGVSDRLFDSSSSYDWTDNAVDHAMRVLFGAYCERCVADLVVAADVDEDVNTFLCHRPRHYFIIASVLCCYDAWCPGSGERQPLARRVSQSEVVRGRLALQVLCAVSALPKGVAGPMLAFLRKRPWCLYAAKLRGIG